MDYKQGTDGIPTPTSLNTRTLRCDYTEIGPGPLEAVTGNALREETYEVSILGFGTMPGSEFRASFFGLPEFREQTRRPILGRIATALFALALSGLGASVFLRRLARRPLAGDKDPKPADLGISPNLLVE